MLLLRQLIPDTVLRSYLRTRRVTGVFFAVVGIALISILIGTWPSRFPTVSSESAAQVPIWRMLVIPVAVLPVIALHSSLADLESVATSAFRIRQRRYLIATALINVACYLVLCAAAFPLPVVAIMGRSWIGWFGLSILSGRLFGWRLAWIIPAGVGVLFWYWGFDTQSDNFHWWEFGARPVTDLASLLLVLALALIGISAYAATPWRRHQLMRRRDNIVSPALHDSGNHAGDSDAQAVTLPRNR